MIATGIYKLEDNYHPTNCFPARSLLQPQYKQGAGHWEVARHVAEQTKIELWLGSQSTRIKWRGPGMVSGPRRRVDEKTLTGTLLMKLHHVKSPSDLCSVDISNQNFVSAKEEDFEQFDSVAYMNATENLLTLEVFRTFPALRELDLSLNGLRNLNINAEDFPHLEILDLSYNNLSPEDIRALGVLPHLKALHLTANGLSSLPLDLAVPESKDCLRFPALEVLLLDDNHLSHPNVFVSLANLRSLKQLNLDRNGIKEVPYLHHVENSSFSTHPLSAKSGIREGLRTRKSAEIQRKRDVLSGRSESADYVVTQSSMDPDRTEVLFATSSPDLSVQGDTPLPRSASKISKISSTSFVQDFALPLAELRYLSLANNKIEHEEDLLAVALFPSLTELTFYGNPFTTSRSGDPPLLTSFLQDKLGIKLVRKKIPKLEKPRIFIPVKANRKVKSPLPKVRKHPPMLGAPLETSFWELWTGAEFDLDTLASLDESEPLPPISQPSAEKGPSVPLLPFEEEPVSGFQSTATFPSEASTLALTPEEQATLDDLYGAVFEAPSMLGQIPSASPLPRGSSLGDQSGVATPTVSASAAQAPSRSLLTIRERSRPEADAPVGTSPEEQEQPEVVPPLGQEAEPLEQAPPIAEEDQLQALQPISSSAGQPAPPPNSPSEQEAPSEPAPPTGSPPGEEGLPGSPPPVRLASVGQNLPKTSPPIESLGDLKPVDSLRFHDQGLNLPEIVLPETQPETNLPESGLPTVPPSEELDQLQPPPSRISLSQGESLSETVSGFLTGIIPPANSLLFTPGQFEVTPSTLLLEAQRLLDPASLPGPSQEQVLPDLVPPTGPPRIDQDLTERPPPPEASPSSGEQDQMDSLLPGVSMSPELNRLAAKLPTQLSSIEEDPLECVPGTSSLSAGRSLADGTSEAKFLPEERVAPELRSHIQSSSRDLHLLFERRLSLSSLSGEDLDTICSSDFLKAEEVESFFMTQVEEASVSVENLEQEETPHDEASPEPRRKPQPVPERYKGYEELLDGPTDPDFIEPRGIQQNVKALEWALRHPLVYREPRARLDSFQKPYVPMEKKVLRIPAPTARKTKAQKLEELLQQMQTPANIVEVPLVCVLRRKKSNWREYRDALALLKDFREQYKAVVAATEEARPLRKKQSSREQRSHAQMLQSLTGLKVRGPCLQLPPAQPTKEDKGL